MVRIGPLRLGKKRTGEFSVKDGKFKMEVKEKFRVWSVFTSAILFVLMMVAFIGPGLLYLTVYFLGMSWIIGSSLIWKIQDWARTIGNKVVSGATWVGSWVIKQPINDYKYGRSKRKEFERSKVYGE